MRKIAIFILTVNSLIYGAQFSNHLIRKGETLSQIASKYNVSVSQIVELNKIENPSLIYPGTELKIYNEEYYNEVYVVKKGDNLNKISKKFSMKTSEIIAINKIKNPDLIYPGMKLKVYSDLNKLGLKYEKTGDNIWSTKELALKYKLNKSLNNYEIAKQLYVKSEVNYNLEINEKIEKLKFLKEALKLENIGNIYYVKEQKDEAIKSYEEALINFEKYEKLNKEMEKDIQLKINRMKDLVLKEGGKYEKNI